ncbi:arginase family protein [Jiangella gansuensis]|uniref:arginase family protein n=1 Tax=Jiangella gansuensis TaxID=281473 RepID=UPI0004BAA01F|nr:arginase family protein [Jiangella gansuensis]
MVAERVLVPYHLDEHRPDLDVPVPASTTVRAPLPADGTVWDRMAVLYDQVADVVADAVAPARSEPAAEPVLVQSADCTTSLGTVAGLQRAGVTPSVVWFDAHGDVQTPQTSASGYVGGMPVRILAGYGPELIATRLRLAAVPEERIVLVDARDLDPPEREYLESSAVRRVSVPALDASVLPDGPIYLHIDLDVVDSAQVPGLLFPVPGGPSLTEVAAAMRRVLDTGRVVAVGLACTWHDGHAAADVVRAALRLPWK